jgi:aminoglycoside 6-adenylyltransferase
MNATDAIERAFTAWAQANEDVRAAFVVGSRARIDHPADQWADLDIIMFARNVERYQNATDWLEQLAPVWVALAGRTVAGDPERLVLFEGGIETDFVFHSSDVMLQVPHMLESGSIPGIILRGTRVLLDKEGVLDPLPPPSRPPAPPPPDTQAFRQTLDRFWFSAVYCARQLRRGELWVFQTGSGGMLGPLLQMVEWHVRAMHGWDYDTWHGGKFIAEWTEPEVYADLCRTFARMDALDGEQALQARLDLFHRLARQVAARLGLDYSAEQEAQILACIDKLQATDAVSADDFPELSKP